MQSPVFGVRNEDRRHNIVMKKRFSIPLGLFGLLILIGLWVIKQHEEALEAANAGDIEACVGVIKGAFFDDLEPGAITNEECKSLANKARAEIAVKILRLRRSPSNGDAIYQQQAIGCALLVQKSLNDEGSFQQHTPMNDVQKTGLMVYSDKNAFGGRVKKIMDCRTLQEVN
jgi:hypothetical protein